MSGREEETNNKNECESPNIVEKAIDKGKDVIQETREKVADAIEPEDTKQKREEEKERNRSLLEKGQDYVNAASEAVADMLNSNKSNESSADSNKDSK